MPRHGCIIDVIYFTGAESIELFSRQLTPVAHAIHAIHRRHAAATFHAHRNQEIRLGQLKDYVAEGARVYVVDYEQVQVRVIPKYDV